MEYRPISDGRPLQRALHHPNPFTGRSLKDRVLFRFEILCSPEGVNILTECTIVGHTLPDSIARLSCRHCKQLPRKALPRDLRYVEYRSKSLPTPRPYDEYCSLSCPVPRQYGRRAPVSPWPDRTPRPFPARHGKVWKAHLDRSLHQLAQDQSAEALS